MDDSLAKLYPEKVREFWDFELNTSSPEEITTGMKNIKIHCMCPQGHIFLARPGKFKQVSSERFCKECLSLGYLHPEILPFWDYEKNTTSPLELSAKGTKGGYYLKCALGHEIKKNIIFSTERPLEFCDECKSFALVYPELMTYWDEEANRIASIYSNKTPAYTSEIRPYFKCALGHSFRASPMRAKTPKKDFCPRCANPTLIDKYPLIVKDYWDYNNNTANPILLASNANGYFNFKCPQRHEFSTVLGNISKQKREFCPECRLIKYNVATTYPEAAVLWDYTKNKLNPEIVSPGKAGLFWFRCPAGHSFTRELRSFKKNKMCNFCYPNESEGERDVAIFVAALGYKTLRNDHTVLGKKEIDIYLPKLNKGIEFNGDHWHCNEMVVAKTKFSNAQALHLDKIKLLKARDIELAFVWAHDWSTHRILVKQELTAWLAGVQPLKSTDFLRKLNSVKDYPCPFCP